MKVVRRSVAKVWHSPADFMFLNPVFGGISIYSFIMLLAATSVASVYRHYEIASGDDH